jgi:predicted dehydrogenase
MSILLRLCSVFLWSIVAGSATAQVRLVIVEPGHFHASLIQQDMYPQVSPQVSVYAPLGPELLDYLTRVTQFNTRADHPTRWELEIHTGDGYFDRMLAEHPGNVVVFAGRNREKIGRIARSLEAGYSVLADKPWIIRSEDLPKLAAALDLAEKKRLVAYDIMTERYEITAILQKELVNTPAVFGELARGSGGEPAITARSVHYLMKTVAGVPLRRPAWFLNIDEVGEGMADVGTHVVDLVQWTAFPSRLLDYRKDVEVLEARRWPTVLSKAQFTKVTGETDFPAHLTPWVKDGRLDYYANHTVRYTVAGVPVALDVRWDWEAEPGSGDVYEATFRGSRSRAEIRQGKAENFRPELYIVPATAALRQPVFDELRKKIASLQKDWPGLDLDVREGEARIVIPEKFRVGHEAHFAQVTRAFLGYLQDPASLPAWEKSNMLVKYFITTKGVELSRRLTPDPKIGYR